MSILSNCDILPPSLCMLNLIVSMKNVLSIVLTLFKDDLFTRCLTLFYLYLSSLLRPSTFLSSLRIQEGAKCGVVGGHNRDKHILGGGHRTYLPHLEIRVEQTDKTKCWSKKNVGLRNILGEKIQKQKNFGSGKILGQNNFDIKNVGSKKN